MLKRLFVIEGTDSSGKETQTNLLYTKLSEMFQNVLKVSFPNYNSEACNPVKMYLNGDFGKNPKDINPYAISTMYAIDRFSFFNKEFKNILKDKKIKENPILICDRYVTSNIVHQASKIEDEMERILFINWLENLEYKKLKSPKPNLVIFLNMPIEKTFELMEKRKNKIDNKDEKDIHESDKNYLITSYKKSIKLAEFLNWTMIDCVNAYGEIKTIEEISNEIYKIVLSNIENNFINL